MPLHSSLVIEQDSVSKTKQNKKKQNTTQLKPKPKPSIVHERGRARQAYSPGAVGAGCPGRVSEVSTWRKGVSSEGLGFILALGSWAKVLW